MKTDKKSKKRIHLSQMDPCQLVSRKEAADFLQISEQTLYRRRKEGLIKGVIVKRNVKFEVCEVLRYIETYRVKVK
jgi:hypothetical protein